MTQWISVKDRLPECEQEVLVLFKGWNWCGVTTGMYEDGTKHTEDSDWCWTDPEYSFEYCEETDDWIISEGWWEYNHFNPDDVYNGVIDRPVTHWMPLPEPPKEDA